MWEILAATFTGNLLATVFFRFVLLQKLMKIRMQIVNFSRHAQRRIRNVRGEYARIPVSKVKRYS